MKTITRKATAWLMVVCLLVGLMPAFGSVMAAEEAPAEQLILLKIHKTDLTDNTTYSFADLFSYTVEDKQETEPSASLTDLQNLIAAKGLDAEEMHALLVDALRSVGVDFEAVSIADILNLPANLIDDTVTYIIAGLRALGVDVDPAYEKSSAFRFLRWFIETYVAVREESDLTNLEKEIESKDLGDQNMWALMAAALKALGDSIKTVSVDDILKLPANIMDDVVTYLFAGLKLLGVDLDSLYEKITSIRFLQWYSETYIAPQEAAGNLIDLEDKIAAKGLNAQDMVELLTAALRSVDKNLEDFPAEDLMRIANLSDRIVMYIFAGLRALGVEVDPLYEKLSANKVLQWFFRTYVQPKMPVQLACDLPDDIVTIDNEHRTITIHAIATKTQEVKFTVSSADPDALCAPVSFTAVIHASPKTPHEWIQILWNALRSFRLKEAFDAVSGLVLSILRAG